MFVTLYSCRCKAGKQKTIGALCRQLRSLDKNTRLVSSELLQNAKDPSEMIMLVCFEDEEALWAAIESPDYRAWYARLMQAAETGPLVSDYERIQFQAGCTG